MGYIYVLEFGGQHADLIINRLNEIGFRGSIRYEKSDVRLDSLEDPAGIILSGGPKNISQGDAPKYDPRMFDPSYNKIPVLGICYGQQLMARDHGASMHRRTREYGEAVMSLNGHQDPLLEGFTPTEIVWMNHGDSVGEGDFQILAYTGKGVPAVIRSNIGPYRGVQFHPEVTHTEKGALLLRNFAQGICGIAPQSPEGFDAGMFVEEAIRRLKDEVGSDTGLLYVSGGVDSTVVAALARQAGIKVKPVHIDAGNERLGEADYVKSMLHEQLGLDVYVLDQSDKFISSLLNLDDPEVKRRKFQRLYNNTKTYVESSFDLGDTILLDGTLATDKRESGKEAGTGDIRDTGSTEVIKTHHNTSDWKGRKVAVLEGLTKQHTRMVARYLELPPEVSERRPFPGPGLFVRYSTGRYEVSSDLMHNANEISRHHGMDAYVMPRKSVGLKGDSRVFEHAVILTGERDWKNIRMVSKRLIEDLDICRVLYLPVSASLVSRPEDDFAYYPMNRRNLDRLRIVTDVVERTIDEYGVKPSQMPVITFGGPTGHINVIRDVQSEDFRTITPLRKPDQFPWDCYLEIHKRLLERLGPAAGLTTFDVSDKPGGTTEWE